jgi:hypothetical protein
MAILDRQHLTPAEVARYVEEAWAALRRGHVKVVNAFHGQAMAAPGATEASARQAALRLEADVLAEMNQTREELGRIAGKQLERLNCKYRNGIFVADREIERLRDALL